MNLTVSQNHPRGKPTLKVMLNNTQNGRFRTDLDFFEKSYNVRFFGKVKIRSETSTLCIVQQHFQCRFFPLQLYDLGLKKLLLIFFVKHILI